jgi:hypothetical protein
MGQEAAGATGLAAGGTAVTPYLAAGTGAVNLAMDIAAASKEKDMMRAAERAATKARLEQQRIQGQNFFEALQVPTAAYDRATREITAQQQQATSALQEGDPRQLAGGLGRIGAVAGELEADTRDAMSKDLFELGKLQAEEQGMTADEMAKIQEDIAIGAQEEASARQVAYDTAQGRVATGIKKGVTGLTDMIKSFGEKTEPLDLVDKSSQSSIEDRYLKPDLSGVKVPGSNPDFITQLLSLFGGQYKK